MGKKNSTNINKSHYLFPLHFYFKSFRVFFSRCCCFRSRCNGFFFAVLFTRHFSSSYERRKKTRNQWRELWKSAFFANSFAYKYIWLGYVGVACLCFFLSFNFPLFLSFCRSGFVVFTPSISISKAVFVHSFFFIDSRRLFAVLSFRHKFKNNWKVS